MTKCHRVVTTLRHIFLTTNQFFIFICGYLKNVQTMVTLCGNITLWYLNLCNVYNPFNKRRQRHF